MAEDKRKISLVVRVEVTREYEWSGGRAEFEIKLPESALPNLSRLMDYGSVVKQILPDAIENYLLWAEEKKIKENEAAAKARLEVTSETSKS